MLEEDGPRALGAFSSRGQLFVGWHKVRPQGYITLLYLVTSEIEEKASIKITSRLSLGHTVALWK